MTCDDIAHHHQCTTECARELLGKEIWTDVEGVIDKLTDLEIRGVIGSDWLTRFIREIANEVVTQRIANAIVEDVLRSEPEYLDTPATEAQ